MALRSLVHGYDELELRIEQRENGSYHVLASTRQHSPGRATASFELPFNELAVENFILEVSRPRGRHRGIDTSPRGKDFQRADAHVEKPSERRH